MVMQRSKKHRQTTILRRNRTTMKKGYIGNCPKHGLVAHDPKQLYIDLKGGAFCPYCLSMLTEVKWEGKKKTNDSGN
jgi:hypothetical protein